MRVCRGFNAFHPLTVNAHAISSRRAQKKRPPSRDGGRRGGSRSTAAYVDDDVPVVDFDVHTLVAVFLRVDLPGPDDADETRIGIVLDAVDVRPRRSTPERPARVVFKTDI